jgi:hypothetical protein
VAAALLIFMAKNQDTRIKGSGIVTIAAGKSCSVVPKDLGESQAQFVVTNHGRTDGGIDGLLYVCDNNRDPAIPVYHHESKTVETGCQFEVINPGSVAVYCVVCQMVGGGNSPSPTP